MAAVDLMKFIIAGPASLGFNIGMSKTEIETLTGKPLGECDIETADITSYQCTIDNGVLWVINFDKEDICYEIKLDIDDNTVPFYISLNETPVAINAGTSFDKIVEILSAACLDWRFDTKRMYLQTACIQLANGARLHFAFGDRRAGDYGLFSLSFLLETHPINIR